MALVQRIDNTLHATNWQGAIPVVRPRKSSQSMGAVKNRSRPTSVNPPAGTPVGSPISRNRNVANSPRVIGWSGPNRPGAIPVVYPSSHSQSTAVR